MDTKLVQLLCVLGMLSRWAAAAEQCTTECTCDTKTTPTVYECANLDAAKLATTATALKTIASVVTLKLTGFTGAELKANTFKDVPHLTALWITTSPNLATIDADAFADLTKLTDLAINDAPKLTALPEAVFQPLKATLTKLTVKKTALTQLPEDVFKDLSKLTNLDLDENKFTKLTTDNFKSVKSATITAKKQAAFDCDCAQTLDLGHWIADDDLKAKIECNLPVAWKGEMLGGAEWVKGCPKPSTTPETTPVAPEKTTPEPEPAFPDWALVIIVAVIGSIIFIVVGIVCQMNKKKYYATMKEREAEAGMPQNPRGYDNQGYRTN